MKFITSNEQQKNFQKNRAIEFEDFLSLKQIDQIKEWIDISIAERIHIPAHYLEMQSAANLFHSSRDLWRSNIHLQKLILQKNWAEIASELTSKTLLRIAFDQLLIPDLNPEKTTPFSQLLQQETTTLEEFSTIQGVTCGLMICLESEKNSKEETVENSQEYHSIFPSQPGNAIYFLPNASIDFTKFCRERTGRFLLIVYAQQKSNYIYQPKDPNTHFLKQLGYVFGDPLKETLHPFIYRK